MYSLGNVEAPEELGNVLVAALPRQSAGPYYAVAVDLIIDRTVWRGREREGWWRRPALSANRDQLSY